MGVRDPAGLCERIPELTELASDAAIARAIERGSPHGVYRAIFWARFRGPLRDRRATLDALLARRRLFLQPIRSAPLLFTLNGIGATVYGSADSDPADGSYVTTHFATFVFVPLFPIAQYLVLDAPGKRRSWKFIGKVPFGPLAWVWNRLLAAGVALAVLFAAGSALDASRHGNVHVVNGLSIPVVASIGDQRAELAPGLHAVLRLATGKAHVAVTRPDGKSIESGDVEVRSGPDVTVWNVLGAAFLYREEIVYSSSSSSSGQPDAEPTIACGDELASFGRVDYAFVEPPKSLQVSSGSGSTTRSHVAVEPSRGPIPLCIAWKAGHGDRQGAAALAVRVAEASGWEPEPTTTAVSLVAKASGDDAAFELARRARDANPGSIDLHRLYQEMSRGLANRSAVVDEYRARYASQPASADSAYLLARVAPHTEAGALLDRTLAEHPDHAYARRAHAFHLIHDGSFAAAADAYDGLVQTDPETAERAMDNVATALVAAGRRDRALELIERQANRADGAVLTDRAVLYGRVASAADGVDPKRWIDKAVTDADPDARGKRAELLLRAGLALDDSDDATIGDPVIRSAVQILRAASSSPADALAAVAASPPGATARLPFATCVLLYAEARRTEAAADVRAKLSSACFALPGAAGAIDELVERGTEDETLWLFDLSARAAALFVRSRVAGLSKGERDGLGKRARADAVLRDPVQLAIGAWSR